MGDAAKHKDESSCKQESKYSRTKYWTFKSRITKELHPYVQLHVQQFFVYFLTTIVMPSKEENLLSLYIPKIIIISYLRR